MDDKISQDEVDMMAQTPPVSKAEARREAVRKEWEKSRSNDTLSQDEIDMLVRALYANDEEDDAEVQTDDTSADSAGNASSGSTQKRKIKMYDFKRPDCFTNVQIRATSNTFETVARELTTAISASLRTLCHIHVASIDQLTYEEFIRSMPTPTVLAIGDWGETQAVIEIDPTISVMFLYSELLEYLAESFSDSADEGRKAYEEMVQKIKSRGFRDLSVRELTLLKTTFVDMLYTHISRAFNENKRILPLFCPTWRMAKETVALTAPETVSMETNPQFAQIVRPSEMCILVTLEVKIADEEGMINVCLPLPFIREKLIKGGLLMDTTRQNDFALVTQPGNSGVSLGDFNMPEGKKLETGTVIELTKMAGEPVDLFDKKTGRIFAHGEVVVSDEKFCVRVIEVLDTPDSDGSGTKKA